MICEDTPVKSVQGICLSPTSLLSAHADSLVADVHPPVNITAVVCSPLNGGGFFDIHYA